jgi:Tol biopolymer transport system component
LAPDKSIFRKLKLSNPRPISGGLGPHRDPALSPDGRWVAWSAQVAGGAQIYACDRAGRLARQISAGNGVHLGAAWSPDARALAFSVRRTDAGRWQIWMADLDSDEPPRCLLQSTRFHYQHPCFSPDGASLLYSSDQGAQADGGAGLWRLDLATADKHPLTQVHHDRHRHPCLDPTGQRLLFTNRAPDLRGGALHLLDLTPDAAPSPAPGKASRAWISASFLTPQLLLGLALTDTEGHRQLRLLNLDTGKSTSLREGDLHAPSAWISPAGRLELAWTEGDQILSAHLDGLSL